MLLWNQKKQTLRRLLAGAVFLLCALALLWLLAAETVPHRNQIRLEPDINGGSLVLEQTYDYGGLMTLTVTLPEWDQRWIPTLEIRGLTAEAKLWLDGSLLYRTHAPSYAETVRYSCLVTLPTDYSGRTLTLTTNKEPDMPMPFLFLTDSGVMDELTRSDASFYAFLTAAFGMVLLLTLGLFLYGLAEGTRPWPLLLLSLAALSQTAYFYAMNLPTGALPANYYGLALCLSRALLYAAPPLYLLLGMKKRRKIFAPFAVLSALIYFVIAGFQTLVPAFSSIASRIGEVCYPAVAALLICAVLEYRDKNPVYQVFVPGFAVCAAGAVLACLISAAGRQQVLGILQLSGVLLAAHQPDSVLYWWSVFLLAPCFLESVLSQLRRMAARDAEIKILSARESLAQEHLAAVQESAASLRELRHETINHYTVLKKLAQAEALDSLGAYLDDLVSEAETIPSISYTAHPAINAVLTTILARAQKLGIAVRAQIDVPETLPFPDMELCTVLMNLLQNALDANALAPEGAEKWLQVSLHIRGAHLYIGIENPRFAPVDYNEKNGLCRTTKTDPDNHGYGLKAVQAVAQKYESELLLEFPDGLFCASTALQMPDQR